MKYTGPPKPIPTEYIHPVDHRVSKGLALAVLIIVLCLDLFYWRPG